MNLIDFSNNKKEIENQNIDKINRIKLKLQAQGLNEYQIERKLEEIFMLPDVLDKITSNKNTNNKIFFYLSDNDLIKFRKVFDVLNYIEMNSTQNWLLLGLIDLILENKIIINKKNKRVVINNG
jgi:hypothetical protein